MAMLLAMFQKMRLIREKNQLVLEQSQYSSKLSRIEKNIERTQKRYTSLFTQLEQRAKTMQNQAKIGLQNMFGMGANSFNPYNYTGITTNVYNNVGQMLMQKNAYKYKESANGDYKYLEAFTQPQYEAMMAYYMQNGTFNKIYEKDSDGNYDSSKPTGRLGNPNDTNQQWTEHQVAFFNQALQQAKMQQQQQQTMCQQLCTDYDTNISIWLEAQKAELEAQQDAALDPLNYEQTMLELDKELKDQRLTRINAELERYNELCKQEAQNSAPSFGLG